MSLFCPTIFFSGPPFIPPPLSGRATKKRTSLRQYQTGIFAFLKQCYYGDFSLWSLLVFRTLAPKSREDLIFMLPLILPRGGGNMTQRTFRNVCNFEHTYLKCMEICQNVNLYVYFHIRLSTKWFLKYCIQQIWPPNPKKWTSNHATSL